MKNAKIFSMLIVFNVSKISFLVVAILYKRIFVCHTLLLLNVLYTLCVVLVSLVRVFYPDDDPDEDNYTTVEEKRMQKFRNN
jgi:hypothetical protein